MDLHARYPALTDLRKRARQRIPKFVWEYLDSGTGDERTKKRNRTALDKILFHPSILHGEIDQDTRVSFLGHRFALPVGIAPIGMSGLIWPDAERKLVKAAARLGIPYTLSSVACQTPDSLAPYLGKHAWFQLYPPRDPEIRQDLLKRVKAAGFNTLVLTVDVPVASRRERQVRSGLTTPPHLTPRLLAQIAMRPRWAMGIARTGMPRMRLVDEYAGNMTGLSSTAHAGYLLRTSPDWEYLNWLRDHWQGPLIVKGVMRAEDAQPLEQAGVDGLWISNHAGRQFDAAQATIEALPAIRTATKLPLILDSGIETGLDILRARALGADLVMMGRGFHYALAALGEQGPDHLADLLIQDLHANMGQIGASDLNSLSEKLV